MALEGELLLARRAVPDSHRVLNAPRSQTVAVRAERHARHLLRMARQDRYVRITQSGQVVPLEAAQVSAGRLPGHSFEQLAGKGDIAIIPGALGQSHPHCVCADTSLI